MPHFVSPTVHWRADAIGTQALPSRWQQWLVDSGSLTQRLKQHWPEDFKLQLLNQGWGRPTPAETKRLQLPARRWALIREVLLCGGGQPRVFARTLIPERTLRQGCPQLRHLGARALGETLFNQRPLQRSPFEYGTLNAAVFNRALGTDYPDESLWGRRSLFYLKQQPLLVQEFFLP